MFVSFLVPVYNVEKYLEKCIDSLLVQKGADFEILLLDDGSTDSSGAVCDRYAAQHPNIRVIHKANEGLLMTRRRGFAEARGDWFICVDSDDALNDPDALKKIRRMIEEKKADLVIYEYVCGAEQSTQPDRYISLFDHPNGYVFQGSAKRELCDKLLLGKSLNPIFIKAVSRNLVDLDTDYGQWRTALVNSQGEDLFQSLPLLDRAERIAYLKEPLYFYRWNPNSISRNVRPEYYYAYRTIYQRTDVYLEKWGYESDVIHRIMQTRINMIFGVLLAERHPDHDCWLRVLREVADDPFFRELWQKRDSAHVCAYYRLMGDLILKKRFIMIQVIKKAVDFIVNVKKRMARRSK